MATDTCAYNQAKMQLESIVAIVDRLNHAAGCDGGDDCTLTASEIYLGLDLVCGTNDIPSDEQIADYHDRGLASDAIDEDPLSVEVRSSWQAPGEQLEPTEYQILLCMGGPAVRIIGNLYGTNPDSARLEYQDWYTPWTKYPVGYASKEALLVYAARFLGDQTLGREVD